MRLGAGFFTVGAIKNQLQTRFKQHANVAQRKISGNAKQNLTLTKKHGNLNSNYHQTVTSRQNFSQAYPVQQAAAQTYQQPYLDSSNLTQAPLHYPHEVPYEQYQYYAQPHQYPHDTQAQLPQHHVATAAAAPYCHQTPQVQPYGTTTAAAPPQYGQQYYDPAKHLTSAGAYDPTMSGYDHHQTAAYQGYDTEPAAQAPSVPTAHSSVEVPGTSLIQIGGNLYRAVPAKPSSSTSSLRPDTVAASGSSSAAITTSTAAAQSGSLAPQSGGVRIIPASQVAQRRPVQLVSATERKLALEKQGNNVPGSSIPTKDTAKLNAPAVAASSQARKRNSEEAEGGDNAPKKKKQKKMKAKDEPKEPFAFQ